MLIDRTKNSVSDRSLLKKRNKNVKCIDAALLKTPKEIKSEKIPSNIQKKKPKKLIQKKNIARPSDSLNLFQEAHFRANKASRKQVHLIALIEILLTT